MTSPLLRRAGPPGPDGTIVRTDPADAGWSYVSFAAHRLAPGAAVRRPADGDEVLVLVLEGRAGVTVGDAPADVAAGAAAVPGGSWTGLGSRASVFDGPPPPLVLAAPGAEVSVTAETDALIGIASAPGGPVRVTRLIDAGAIHVEERGTGVTARRVHHLLPPAAEAGRLIAFEVFTPGGNWSSYPPHKHDTEDQPRESYIEELYFYRFAKPQGYALQRVYTPDRTLDEVMAPQDADVVLVPRGYHPVGAPAGYDCYYLNVMAGHTRLWHFTIDPDHAWLMDWTPPS
ncbi:MAG: 5-deoxy-glucuronate isomerase [Chloroflexota bacterium]